jgi:hypothetical protein
MSAMLMALVVGASGGNANAQSDAAETSATLITVPDEPVAPSVGERGAPSMSSKTNRDLLMACGVNPDVDSMLRLLQEGIPPEAEKRGLAGLPKYKCEAVSAAIQELGVKGDWRATSTLSEIARGQMPLGVQRILDRDLESTAIQLYDTTKAGFIRVLTQNAVVSLGLLGDENGLPALRDVLRGNHPAEVRYECAIAMGMLGSSEGFLTLSSLAQSSAAVESIAAFDGIYFLTGRNYGVWRETSIARREEAVRSLQAWVTSEGRNVKPIRTDILRRRIEGPPAAMPDPGSLRSLLRTTRNPVNQAERIKARNAIYGRPQGVSDEFRQLALDPMEDSDIRCEAARWYAMAQPKKAKDMLHRMRKDPNPSVAGTAETLIKSSN